MIVQVVVILTQFAQLPKTYQWPSTSPSFTYAIAQNISMAKFKSKFNLRNCLDHVNAQLNTHLSVVGPATKRINVKKSLLNPSHGNDQYYEWQRQCAIAICWRPTSHQGCRKRSSSSRRAVWFAGSGARSQACQTCQGHRRGEAAQVNVNNDYFWDLEPCEEVKGNNDYF